MSGVAHEGGDSRGRGDFCCRVVGCGALIGIAALIVCVGATNIYNFMDGINGITAGYSLAVLLPLFLLNRMSDLTGQFVDGSLIVVAWVLVGAYLLFMKKYYHLHEEYLVGLQG